MVTDSIEHGQGRRGKESEPRERHEDASGTNVERVLQALQAAGAWLDQHVAAVNALNVFPVPDGDTGTNMLLTMRAALEEAAAKECSSVAELAKVVSHGALMGARGNSGVILSQILRGVARSTEGKKALTGPDVADALHEGAVTAYKGVMKPVEGTILTVVREASEAALCTAQTGADYKQVLSAALDEAKASLERTPTLLPVLADAGVVDSGGQGLVYLLEGIMKSIRGETLQVADTFEQAVEHMHELEGEFNYDTQFIIQGETLDVDTIRETISTMGDSVLVVGDEAAVKVHVHCDDPGNALTYGTSQGQVTAVIIENMQLQFLEFKEKHRNAHADTPQRVLAPTVQAADPLSDTCLVAVVSGDGLERVFESLGVNAIVPGGQTMNPSTQDLIRAIDAVAAEKVILLPNNKNVILAAQQAQAMSSKNVSVIPTKTVPQGISALLAFNYQADVEANVASMMAASNQVQTAEITKAVRTVQVNGLSIEEGQIIGLLNGNLTTVGENVADVAGDLLRDIDMDELEIVTIYYGEDVSAEDASALSDAVEQSYPDLEVEVLDGGQAHYYYIISVE